MATFVNVGEATAATYVCQQTDGKAYGDGLLEQKGGCCTKHESVTANDINKDLKIEFFFAKGEEKSQSTCATSEPTTVTQNPRNGNPRSLQQWLGLDHQILGQRDSPRETGRAPAHSRKPISCPIARSMPVWRWSGRWGGGGFLTRLRPRELSEENLRLQGPSASHFTCENNQSGSSMCTGEFWIHSLFPHAGLTQSGTVFPSTTTVRRAVGSQRRHQLMRPSRLWPKLVFQSFFFLKKKKQNNKKKGGARIPEK